MACTRDSLVHGDFSLPNENPPPPVAGFVLPDAAGFAGVAPNAKPPVCKIMDIGKYKYDQQKKASKAKKNQKKVELKEIKLRPVTEVHDYTFKIKNAQKFLSKGDKVKFTIKFRGRELQHVKLGNDLMDKIKVDMENIGKIELQPKFDGKQMIMVVQPV